jgi:hypothetical protein
MARAAVGLPEGFRFYDLRHTGLTLSTRSGAMLKDTMVRAGQSSEKAAMIYQHSDAERKREVAKRLDKTRRAAGRVRRLPRGGMIRHRARGGHAMPDVVQTTTKPRAAGLGLCFGAGDENRTRALSLGITRHLVRA